MESTDIELIDGKYTLGQKSVVGDLRRKWEDRTYVGRIERDTDDPLIVGIVADGVGSADNGARGAELAIQTVINDLGSSQGDDIPRIIKGAIETANAKLFRENEEHGNDGLTTLVVGVVYKERFYIGNVGDSRAYWAQSSGKILQLTRDHTYFNIYGGDPKSEEAGAVVNAVGKKSTVQVDLGFYLKGNVQDQKETYRLGMAGLPLHKGDSFILCSDGLIKEDPRRPGETYASNKEIVDAVNSEYRPNLAAIKMVSRAEGQRPDDNVSAVTIQYLTPDIVVQMKANTQQAQSARMLRRTFLGVGIAALVVLVGVLGSLLVRTIRENSILANQTPIMITNTFAPTGTPTKPIDPGKARIDQVNGVGASVGIGQFLNTGARIDSGGSGIQILVGESTGKPPSIMYLFPQSVAQIDFGEQLAPILESGTIYIQPGVGLAEVHFAKWNDLKASVSGSRMIVEVRGTDVWIYCFEGTCGLFYGNAGQITNPGFKRVYHTDTGVWDDQVKMDYNEMWKWNVDCNTCMNDLSLIPTPTPTRVIDYSGIATAACEQFKINNPRGTPCP